MRITKILKKLLSRKKYTVEYISVKLTLSIMRVFGFAKGMYHLEDLSVDLSTTYVLYDKDADYYIEDVKSQVYYFLSKDSKLEYRCRMSNTVCVKFETQYDDPFSNRWTNDIILHYSDDRTLYYPCNEDEKSLERDRKINSILK